MRGHVVCHRLKLLQQLLCFVNNGFVFQYIAVVREVDGSRLTSILTGKTLRFTMTFAESLEGRNRLLAQTKGRIDAGEILAEYYVYFVLHRICSTYNSYSCCF